MIVTVAEQRGKNELSDYLANWPGKARSPVRWTGIAIASMDYIHDDASRRWLFDVAMNGDSSPIGNDEYLIPGGSYFALQLLRGYEPTPEMRKQIEEALANVKASNTVERFPNISRSDALRSLVSSWDYAKNLPDRSTGSKYLAFQSTLWRYNAIAPHTFIDQSFRYVEIARQLAKTWDVCHDRFVLEIFQNPNTTPDEAKIAICLVEKLTDTNELERIAKGDSPGAHYAKDAIEILRRNRKTSPGLAP